MEIKYNGGNEKLMDKFYNWRETLGIGFLYVMNQINLHQKILALKYAVNEGSCERDDLIENSDYFNAMVNRDEIATFIYWTLKFLELRKNFL